MRHFITLAASLVLLAAAPALAQMKHDEITENPTCAPAFKVCPDGTWMSPIGARCEIPPCGGYKPPPDPYAPPPGATGHYKMPVRPKGDTSAPVAPVNTCNNEVFTCADGTNVTRVPPMCNFTRCPDVEEEEPVEETEESPEETPEEEPSE